MKKTFTTIILVLTFFIGQAQGDEYTKGVFIVNEDWYGHNNSTVNYIDENGIIDYRVFQKVNEGHELGATTQFGTIYGNKFYFISKQEKDPGATVVGSRLAICDAKTMKLIKEFQYFADLKDKEGDTIRIDGRMLLGVNEHKAYIATSNGIWILDIDNLEVKSYIEGTFNKAGSLYRDQIGMLTRNSDYVFAIHQQKGLLVIDTETDKIIKTIEAPIDTLLVNGKKKIQKRGFGSVVLSKDGNLWISVASNRQGNGAVENYIYKLDPISLDTTRIYVPEGMYAPGNSWYAWTADGFCASKKENKLYWNGGKSSWFKGQLIFSYDIDNEKFSEFLNLESDPEKWKLYGTGFRIHPVTDELYCFYFKEFQDPTHSIVRLNNKGEKLAEYPLESNYWFPAIPVFPDNELPYLTDDFPELILFDKQTEVQRIYLGDKVKDEDSMESAIVKSIENNSNPSLFSASIKHDTLTISRTSAVSGDAVLNLKINSNGQLIHKTITVKSNINTAVELNKKTQIAISLSPTFESMYVNMSGKFELFSINGDKIIQIDNYLSEDIIDISLLNSGVYILKVRSKEQSFVSKFLKK